MTNLNADKVTNWNVLTMSKHDHWITKRTCALQLQLNFKGAMPYYKNVLMVIDLITFSVGLMNGKK
jgi:hypothetical protein